MHLNVCSRHNKQTIFLEQKILAGKENCLVSFYEFLKSHNVDTFKNCLTEVKINNINDELSLHSG